jgi:hypothetical protein
VHKPPDCDMPAETQNSVSPAVFLQTSGLRGFSTEVRGAKLVAVVAEVGLAGGRLLRQAGL